MQQIPRLIDIQDEIARESREVVHDRDFDLGTRGRGAVSYEQRRPLGGLGVDEALWDARFVGYLYDDPGERDTVWLRLTPASLTVQDLSYAGVPD
ncbi:hypothetical protein ACIBW9_34185 [Streptomyces sp. NPDC049541]|uniref:hypothetical protein n=1 Tax=Streptomyces sp. NPDC049541 TaxID=3365594 RepID=UPI00379770F8